MGDKAEDIKSLVNQCNQLLSPVIEIVNKSTAKVKSSEINAAINSLVTTNSKIFLDLSENLTKMKTELPNIEKVIIERQEFESKCNNLQKELISSNTEHENELKIKNTEYENELSNKKTEYETELNNITTDYENKLKNQQENYEREIAAKIENYEKEITTKTEDYEMKIQLLKEELKDATQKISEMEEEIQRLTSNPPNDQLIENYERQIEENEEKIAIIQQNMKIEVDSLKNQLLALNNENEQMKMQLEVSYQEKELFDRVLSHAEQERQNYIQKVKDVESQLNKVQQHEIQLIKTVETIEKEKDLVLQNSIPKEEKKNMDNLFNVQLQEMESKIMQYKKYCSQLLLTINKNNESEDSLRMEISQLEIKRDELLTKIKEYERSNAQLETIIKENNEEIIQRKKDIALLNQKLLSERRNNQNLSNLNIFNNDLMYFHPSINSLPLIDDKNIAISPPPLKSTQLKKPSKQ